MYSCVLRINYTNIDIRILHTLMYQIDLCYTDRNITPGGALLQRSLNDATHRKSGDWITGHTNDPHAIKDDKTKNYLICEDGKYTLCMQSYKTSTYKPVYIIVSKEVNILLDLYIKNMKSKIDYFLANVV